MELKSLKSFETLNEESLFLVCGGQSLAKPSRRWDSEKMDSKKHDDYTKEVV